MTEVGPTLEQFFTYLADDVMKGEKIDNLPQTRAQSGAQKADYFFRDRRIVCEVKSLIADTVEKVVPYIQELAKRRDFPRFAGEIALDELLRHLPDGEKHKQVLEELLGSTVDRAVRKADRQIRSTIKTFGLDDSGGLLVLLVDGLEVLQPLGIVQRVQAQLRNKGNDGRKRYQALNYIVVISDSHWIAMDDGTKGVPFIILHNNYVADNEAVKSFADDLQNQFARRMDGHLEIPDLKAMKRLRFNRGSSSAPSGRSDPYLIKLG
jgi:hypothetical protein